MVSAGEMIILQLAANDDANIVTTAAGYDSDKNSRATSLLNISPNRDSGIIHSAGISPL